MQLKTSFCNFAIIRKNLTRGWPLWLVYTILWMILSPLSLVNHYYSEPSALRFADDILEITANGGTVINGFYGLAVAVLLFSYLFTSRSVNTMAALPIGRATMFGSNVVTGVLVSVVPNLLVSLAIVAVGASMGFNLLTVAFQSFCINTLTYVFCFGVAILCVALVGSALATLLMYILLNFVAVVINAVTMEILSGTVFGMPNNNRQMEFIDFSPLYSLLDNYPVERIYEENFSNGYYNNELVDVFYTNWQYLFVIAIVGLVLGIVAFFLLQHRHMETAGDFMAVKPLRPAFKYIFSAGCSLVLGYLTAMVLSLGGNFWGVLGCMVFGGFIGYFWAEIMLKKSFHVWRKEWVGFGWFTFVLVVAMLGVKFDVYGYEKHIPALEDITALRYTADYYNVEEVTPIDDPTLIYDMTVLHQRMISEKDAIRSQEAWYTWENVSLQYVLKNGKTVTRSYGFPVAFTDYKDKSSLIYHAGAIYNDPVFIVSRTEADFLTLGYGDLVGAEIRHGMETYDEMTGEQLTERETLELTREEAYDLYQNCLIPDLEDGAIGYDTDFKPYYTDWDTGRTAIYFYYTAPPAHEHPISTKEVNSQSISFVVYEESTRTAPALEALGIPIYQTNRVQ